MWQRYLHMALTALVFAMPSPAQASDKTERAGDILMLALPLSGFAAAVVKKDRQGQIQFAKSLGTNLAVTLLLKSAVDKQRPNGECCDSFPSGHASVAFSGATFIHRRYGIRYGIPAYLTASFVAYSRVASDKHYVEDVVAGAAIGVLSSYFFTSRYEGFEVTPVVAGDFLGLSVRKRW